MTEKLYYADGYMKEFKSSVCECIPEGNGYWVALDSTAFFPGGGGQPADTGTIGDCRVNDVRIKNGIIYHCTDKSFRSGEMVSGKIDWEKRFRRMQNHSGEHIICGIINSIYGFDNVGFHMGSEDITCDIDGVIDKKGLERVEYEANCAVYKNVEITSEFPSAEQLSAMKYRSKRELTEAVRIVSIDGYDRCACCAVHAAKTGEIGIIKILDAVNYKGGMRIHMLCGFDALEDYKARYFSTSEIAKELSVKDGSVYNAVLKVKNELNECRYKLSKCKSELVRFKADKLPKGQKNICIFDSELDRDAVREMANYALPLCSGICAVFSGSDRDGYMYAISSSTVELTKLVKDINANINGKGGGSDDMLQGSSFASKSVIEEYFRN